MIPTFDTFLNFDQTLFDWERTATLARSPILAGSPRLKTKIGKKPRYLDAHSSETGSFYFLEEMKVSVQIQSLIVISPLIFVLSGL